MSIQDNAFISPQKLRRTKIVATLGPASRSEAKIRALLEAGVDLVRLNMSHGDHDGHRKMVERVRLMSRRLKKHVGIIMDLCGPKIRVGRFAQGAITLRSGAAVLVTTRAVIGEAGVIPSQYRRLHKDVQAGERILLDDGNMELKVIRVEDTEVHCEVVYGGQLSDNKGLNLPDTHVSVSSFTAKDRKDAQLAMEVGADYLALSFVRSARDVQALRRHMKKLGTDIPVIAKIEKPEAVKNIEAILMASDGIMVARGDLGIELAAEKVPLIQRDLIQMARVHNRPVIVATQMLDSMMARSRPTRAEVGDVANAALTGADAVMLSGETAAGKFPLRAVETMVRILREMESYQWQHGEFAAYRSSSHKTDVDPVRAAVAHAAAAMAQRLHMDAFIVPTWSGFTARVMASERGLAPTLGVCAEARICQRMSLYWGVIPILMPYEEIRNWRSLCQAIHAQCELTRPGNTVLIVSGFNDDPQLSDPVLKVLKL